jgi:preprotein translocase subunit SecD
MKVPRSVTRCAVVMVSTAMALAACGSMGETSTTAPISSPHPKRAAFTVALGTPGAPNPADASFTRDQMGLYDPAQFGNPDYYPPNCHWRVDLSITSTSVRSARVLRDNAAQGWLIDLVFTPDGGARFRQDATTAMRSPIGSPGNRIAFFVGSEVISAPIVVTAPSGDETAIMGNWSEAQARTIASEIAGT